MVTSLYFRFHSLDEYFCFKVTERCEKLLNINMLQFVQSLQKLFHSYHYVLLRAGHGGKDIDTVSREISSLIGPFIDAVRPPRVKDLLSSVLVQHDQVSFQEAQEC